tara:strand:+ start:491 stop:727 length:237 start_codon:yes stop_codon:yes gene_type:complete
MQERYVVMGLEYIADGVCLPKALHNGFKTKLQAQKIVDRLYGDDQVLECEIVSVSELQKHRDDGDIIKPEDVVAGEFV